MDLNEETIYNLLEIKPPYSSEQIVDIELMKKPSVTEYNRNTRTCSFCVRPETSNPLSQHDKFLTCADCGAKAHSYCLKYSASLVEHIRNHKLKWQCYECKRCSVCLQTSENLLLCDKCDRGYHKECCKPKLFYLPKGDYTCHVCKDIYLKDEKLLMTNTRKTPGPKKGFKKSVVSGIAAQEAANDSSTSISSVKGTKKATKKRKLSVTSSGSSQNSQLAIDLNEKLSTPLKTEKKSTKSKLGSFKIDFLMKTR